MFDATPSSGLYSGFAHPGRSPPCFQSSNAAMLVALLVFFIAATYGMNVWTGRSLLVSGFENAFLFKFRLSSSLLMMGGGHSEKALERSSEVSFCKEKFHPLSPQALFDKASVDMLEVVGVEPTVHAIMLVLIAAAIEAAAMVYLLVHFFRFAAAAAFSGASARLFGLEVGSVLVELIKLVAGCWDVSTNGCLVETGFVVLSVEYFSAGGAAAALLLVACVVCVATAAFHACRVPPECY